MIKDTGKDIFDNEVSDQQLDMSKDLIYRGNCMKYCSKCGESIPDDKNFCSSCGTPVSNNNTTNNNAQLSILADKLKNLGLTGKEYINSLIKKILQEKNFKLTKVHKIILITTCIALVLGIAGFQVGKTLTSKDRLINEFTNSLINKDTNTLVKIVKCSDPRLKIDESSINSYLAYLDKNPSYLQSIITSLNQQSANFDKKITISQNNNAANPITLKIDGTKFLFYDNYVFELKPQFINLHTNYNGTQILMNDKELCKADKQDFSAQLGPFLPGTYKMQAIYKTDYASLTKNADIDLIGSAPLNVDLSLNGSFINISSPYENANLFINGNDTGLKIKDAKNFGPISTDGTVSIYAQMEFPWGIIKSDEVKITGSYINLKFNPVNDSLKDTLMNTINDFNKSWLQSVINRDNTKLTNADSNMISKNSSNIESMKSNKKYFKGTLTKTVYDLDSVQVFKSDDKFFAEICDAEYYDSCYYKEDETNITTKPDTILWKYKLIYDETSKKWLVYSDSTQLSFNPKNKKEFS